MTSYGMLMSTVALVLILMMAMTGCYVPHAYYLHPEDVALARSTSPPSSLPARRVKDGTLVRVRTSTLQLETARASGAEVWIRSRAFSKMVSDASGLTWFGTVASIAGGLMIVLGYAAGQDGLKLPGLFLAPMSEAFMITGTVLWVRGANQHPQETNDSPSLARVPLNTAGITF